MRFGATSRPRADGSPSRTSWREGQIDADLAGYLARARAETALVDGDADSALAIARDGLIPLEGADDHFVRSPLLVLTIQAAAEVAEAERAAQGGAEPAAEVATALAELESQTASAPMVAAIKAHAVAEASRMDGESDPERWADAAARYGEIPDPFGVAYARYRSAEAILRRDGIKADVGALLRDAADDAAALGALPLYRSIETLARRARVPMDRPEPAKLAPERERRPAGLSAREIEVLRLVADGRSNGEIGEALFISRKTAGVHVTHILDKLGVANRVEAAMAAGRLGLLDDPGRGSVGGLAARDVLPGRDLDRDAAVGVRRADEDLVHRPVGSLDLLDAAEQTAGLIGDGAFVHMDGAGIAVAALPEQRRGLFAGAVVLVLMVDRENELPAAIEVASAGSL